jgi:DNA repair protein RecN (Recombination protein N)
VLSSLHIRNLAVVAAADVEFAAGLTVLTGETGAGKSILVDALALALGARGEGRLVRTGARRAEISATFDADSLPESAQRWLANQALDLADECVVRRIVTAEGRSRGFINDQSVSMQSLRELGEQLLDLCGQQAHLQLRHTTAQRELLDQFGGHTGRATAMSEAHCAWREAAAALQAHDDSLRDNEQRADLLRFQLQELEALDLQTGEYAELEQSHRILAASQHIESGLQQALAALYEAEDGSAQQTLGQSSQLLGELAETDPELEPAAKLVEEASVLVGEAAMAVRERLAGLDHDPEREAQVADRLAAARNLARKHRVAPEELPGMQEQLKADLDAIANGESRQAELQTRLDACASAMTKAATGLSRARKKAAAKLGEKVTELMQSLGMPGGRFEVALEKHANGDVTAYGAEAVTFMVAPNPGQAGGPLAKVASGGELSRISLALQVAVRGQERTATLVFDEVDTGVGGGVAEIVGQQLHALADTAQVLCVTHLPQVASQGDQHLRVSKTSDGAETRTTIVTLDTDERVEEVARMLGGVKITSRTRDHAREMLAGNDLREAG